MRSFQLSFASTLLLSARYGLAIELNTQESQSVNNAAKTIVENIVGIYNASNSTTGIPGLFPMPYYWWESGLAFDSLVNYWALTGDGSYNDLVSEGLLWQVGPNNDYMPPNQTKSLGNDDQASWALAAMTAAEKGFQEPPSDSGVDSWLQLAQNAFDDQVLRWDTKTCDGGLRWQVFSFNAGYDYKNAASNGDFMQLAARLFRYTGNQTYSEWASKASEWSDDSGLVDTDSWAVYDGAPITGGCKNVNKLQWTMNIGTYMSAYAYMYNTTSSSDWSKAIMGLYRHAFETFLTNSTSDKLGVLVESACQPRGNCNVDQQAFRAILARALANTAALAPGLNLTVGGFSTPATVQNLIDTSAEGAAGQCSGGTNGTTCGSDWSTTKFDGSRGLGQDLSALEMILATKPSAGVRTDNSTGTTGHGDGTATTTTGTGSAESPTGTNGAGKYGVSMIVLAAAAVSAFIFGF